MTDPAALTAAVGAQNAAYPDSEVTQVPEDGDYDHRLIDQALLQSQICTRLTADEAVAWLNRVRMSGTTHGWTVSEDVTPVTCSQFPATHRHIIADC